MSGAMLQALQELVRDKAGDFSETEREALKFLLTCLNYHSEWKTWEVNREYALQPNIEELALLIRRIKNREQFLPYPITGNWSDKLVRLEAQFKNEGGQTGLYETMENTIKNELLPRWLEVKKTDFLKPLDDFFEFLAKSGDGRKVTMEIFSMNYDMVLEKHFEEKKAKPYRGFYSGEWRGFGKSANSEEADIINLYKLHGSLDWVRLTDGSVREKSINDESFMEGEEEIRIDHDPFIIFGHGTKFFSVEPFFSLIQNFSKMLKERDYFFVIGYSFFDPYINNLLIQAVKDGGQRNKKIIIVNPSFAYKHPLHPEHFATDESFGTILDEDNAEAKRKLTDYLEDIQRNAFYSELPEFNIKQVPSESIFYVRETTSEFLKRYFGNGGENLLKLIESFETQERESLPF